jgi:two-component system sensor histidine kinase ChvG
VKWPRRSLAAKAILLAVIFLVVPVILYQQFNKADREKQDLLLSSVREQGHVLAQALLPLLGEHPALPQISQELARFADSVTTVKLLFGPPGGGFFYIASQPTVPPAHLDAERQQLEQQGILDRLASSCDGDLPVAFRYAPPDGKDEVVTSLTPLKTASGCWAIVTSFAAASLPGSHLGVPYWATPEVKFAAIIYLAMVVLTLTTFLSVGRGLRHFTERARAIRDHGPGAGGFVAQNEIPELRAVAEEFDRMVEVLRSSADDIRRAAEDNAHAFKTPIAVIRQSLEPLRRAIAADNQRSLRAFGLIESSLDKLDGLVSSARKLDVATADLIDTRRTEFDLSALLGRLLHDYADTFSRHQVTLRGNISPQVFVIANEEMIEVVVENILSNAISFSPKGESIGIRLAPVGDKAELLIGDSGPGVPEADIGRIFDRYFSQRPAHDPLDEHSTHFGIGLWIARRNIETLGGSIVAENRNPHGLLIRIQLPLAGATRALPQHQKAPPRLS